MFYVIESCTDLRDPRNKVISCSTEKKAIENLKKPTRVNSSNQHIFTRGVYEVTSKKPSLSFLRSELSRKSGSIYSPRTTDDVLASWVISNQISRIKAGA